MKSKIDVQHVAKLAKLPLTQEESERFEKQLEDTLSYIEQLNEVDTNGITTTSQVTGLENVSDEDAAKPSLSQDESIKNAKNVYNGMFKVDAILEG